MCSKNEATFSVDAVTGELTVTTEDMQEGPMRKLEELLGVSLGIPTKDETLKREFHGPAPVKIRLGVGAGR